MYNAYFAYCSYLTGMISAEEFKHYSTLGSPGETPDHEMVISIQEQFEHLDANRDGTLDPTEIRIWAAPGIILPTWRWHLALALAVWHCFRFRSLLVAPLLDNLLM